MFRVFLMVLFVLGVVYHQTLPFLQEIDKFLRYEVYFIHFTLLPDYTAIHTCRSLFLFVTMQQRVL